MLPLAPARLSTTTVWPRPSPIGLATTRATKSRPPPGPDATRSRTGLVGYAGAGCAATGSVATASASPGMAALHRDFIGSPRGNGVRTAPTLGIGGAQCKQFYLRFQSGSASRLWNSGLGYRLFTICPP